MLLLDIATFTLIYAIANWLERSTAFISELIASVIH